MVRRFRGRSGEGLTLMKLTIQTRFLTKGNIGKAIGTWAAAAVVQSRWYAQLISLFFNMMSMVKPALLSASKC